METAYPGVSIIIREAFTRQSLEPNTIDIMISSLAVATLKQYNCAYKKWWHFCTEKEINFFHMDIPTILNFFTILFNNGASYTTLNTYRSALALIFGKSFSEDNRLLRFMKGVYKNLPSFPKYHTTWDPNLVLDFVAKWYPNEDLPLDVLTQKLVTLLALSTAQRVQTLSKIRLSNIKTSTDFIEIVIDDIIKTSVYGRPAPKLTIPFFRNKEQICPAKILLVYINVTNQYRNDLQNDYLILTTRKPIHNASSSTISRWIKSVLTKSGIDTSVFSAHSTRHAATSSASRKGVSIDVIKKTAGWTGNSLVFSKFYNRPLPVVEDLTFANAILDE